MAAKKKAAVRSKLRVRRNTFLPVPAGLKEGIKELAEESDMPMQNYILALLEHAVQNRDVFRPTKVVRRQATKTKTAIVQEA